MENFFLDNKDMLFKFDNFNLAEIVELYEDEYRQADKYEYAPENYEEAMLNYKKSLEIMGQICGEEIEPMAEDIDEEGQKLENGDVKYHPNTKKALELLRKAGFTGVTIPRKYNGLNFPTVIYIMLIELVARAEAGLMNIFSLQDIGETIFEFASEEIKEKYVKMFANGEVTGAMILTEPGAGSDLQRVRTKAVYDEKKDEWKLYGTKRFITNGNADVSLVLARSEEGTTDARGLSMFLIEKDDSVQIRRIEDKLGLHGSPTCEMQFNGTEAKLIGRRRMGLIKYVMELMNGARLGIAGQALGIAEAAYRAAYDYAKEREQFGKSIENFPAVYDMLTDMRINIEAARALTYYTSQMVDYKKAYQRKYEQTDEREYRKKMKEYKTIADTLTPMSKAYSSEMCNDVAYKGLQVHGGDGFMKDYDIQRHYRDARITNIYEGTTQLQIVAAIRGVVTKKLEPVFDELENKVSKGCNEQIAMIKEMRKKLNNSIKNYKDMSDEEKDFYAKYLVDMATKIITSYLLLIDGMRIKRKMIIAKTYIRRSKAEINKYVEIIENLSGLVVDNKELIYDIE
ncbi:MAG: acyl-CoA dehydrogenase [Candidatus Mcinerneyibacterium aminivorans]|uniref:Acyl-CoA dehydrogenase n=1 Tax=Candidatus Mcinerneyibacterium aminivorans TaxID=2703815 RepID=A0A5D0ME92_9BACT|nr:MAG: acyl-CoA dehydrogenase [Candidatus Mcinerneyibacterium aminivorans]